MEKEYAQALFDLGQKPNASAEELVKRLVAHLRETGREKLLPRILREYKRLEERHAAFEDQLEIAAEHEKKTAETEAKELGISAKAVVNESLITGWRARTGSRLIDRSGKRALIDLYREIVKNA